MDEQKGGAQGAVCRLSEASAGPGARLVSSQPAWGTGFLTVSQDQGSHLTLYVENLRPSQDADYRAWLIFQDGQPSFLGSLFIGPAGRGTVTLAFDPDDVAQRGLPAKALYGVGISAGSDPILEGKLVWEPSRSPQAEPAVSFFHGAPEQAQATEPHPFFPDSEPGAWQPAKPPVQLAPDPPAPEEPLTPEPEPFTAKAEPEPPADLGVSAIDTPNLPHPLRPAAKESTVAEPPEAGVGQGPAARAEQPAPLEAEPTPVETQAAPLEAEPTPLEAQAVPEGQAQPAAQPEATDKLQATAPQPDPAPAPVPTAQEPTPAAAPKSPAKAAAQALAPAAPGLVEEIRCQLEPQHALAYRSNGAAILDLGSGSMMITLRQMPAPKLFGKSATTGIDYALFRAWASHSSRKGTLPLGSLRKIWDDTYRLQLSPGLDLRPYDTLFITVEEASVDQEPTGPSIMAGHY